MIDLYKELNILDNSMDLKRKISVKAQARYE